MFFLCRRNLLQKYCGNISSLCARVQSDWETGKFLVRYAQKWANHVICCSLHGMWYSQESANRLTRVHERLKIFLQSKPDVADKRKTQTNTRTCKTQSPSKLKCCREMSKHDQAAVYHRGKIFYSASSASVPTQICCAVERMCRLKGPLQPLVPGVSHITGEFGRIAEQKVPRNPSWRRKQFEISRRLKCSKDKRHPHVCVHGGILLSVITRDMRGPELQHRSVLCNFRWGLEPFSSLIISQAPAMKTSACTLQTCKYTISFTVLLPD